MRPALCALGGALFTIALPLTALAQDAKGGSVLAYDEAEQLMAQGKISEACPKYAESQRLDPQLGTLLHLADCLERNGQTASAWASFREAAELAEKKGDPRNEVAEQRVQALVPKLSRLQINVSGGNEVHVERDHVIVGQALFGAPVPMDPGPHTITASAPGRRTWTGKIVIPADGSITTVTVPELVAEVPTSPESSVAPTVETTNSAGASEADRGLLQQRWPALAALGVGLVGVGVGTAFGLKSMSQANEADEHCDATTCRDTGGIDLTNDAIASGNISTIGFIVGGVGLAAGAVLWFTLPSEGGKKEASSGLDLGLSPRGVTLRRVF